jgi:predicted CoA-substrate-specific enzyme activase
MITAGVDIGTKTVKVVIAKDTKILGKGITHAAFNIDESVQKAWGSALRNAGIEIADVERYVVTGAGREMMPEADRVITEVGAAAKGASQLDQSVRTVIDVGAEESRAVRINEAGKVIDFVINEKCAAGTGSFAEAIARALEIKLDELGPLSLQSTQSVPMNAQCTVFAESEMVSLLHDNIPRADIARSIHDAVAHRVAAMLRRIGIEEKILLIGGMSKNVGFVDSLKRSLKTDVFVPKDAEFAGAYGAALVAAETK